MKSLNLVALLLAALLLQGCIGQPLNKQSQGNIMGGLVGGMLGSQFGKGKGKVAMSGLGAVLGALAGGQVGAQMDAYDRQFAAQASQQALESAPSGKAVGWRNPDNGHSGSVIPTRTFQDNGMYCREFQQKINIGGKLQSAYGTACRMPDGQWRIVQ